MGIYSEHPKLFSREKEWLLWNKIKIYAIIASHAELTDMERDIAQYGSSEARQLPSLLV